MSTRQESTRKGRWSELLLGGAAAGLGAPLMLRGLRRFLHLGQGGSSASMGWAAGLLGALVAGGLARRRLHAGSGGEEREASAASGQEVRQAVERGPRRGPSGREQPWHEALASTPG
ncbi:hypothetical protein [Pyxidicoccus caerfyrddinensis]|uniref:hypothetical protein n=1 Tax=Pyxidicoccus caerfyrddinensis TaxID=2709663 RepID=UPI001F08320B|nr:hypothetical protein [Pyxidicoccus caerfyrddinensis]